MMPARRPLRAASLLFTIAAALAAAPAQSPRAVTWTTRAMGTYFNVTLVTPDSAGSAALAARAQARFRRVDSLMTNWTQTSEVARINREGWPGPTTVEPEVARVIGEAMRTWEWSDHTYDITVEPLVRAWGFLGGHPHVPTAAAADSAWALVGAQHLAFDEGARALQFGRAGMKIDLGGIAKGYGVDAAARVLQDAGVTNALVNVSGNMLALGHSASGGAWRIGIRDPRDRMAYFAHLTLSGEGISTSGKYEQFVEADGRTYGHILDPRSGRPAEGLLSVTVVGPSALTCDAVDTPLFVLGLAEARRKAIADTSIAVVLVAPGRGVDTVWVESALRSRFVLEPEARGVFEVRTF